MHLPKQTVRVCIPRFASSALFAIAQTKDYFNDENLHVEMEVQELGKACIKKLIDGQVEFAVAYLTPVARALVQGDSLSVLSETHSSIHNTSIIYSTLKSQIKQPRDLSGKRIALVPGTNAETLLHLYLTAHGIQLNGIQLVNSSQAEIPMLLENGKADAAIIWDPVLTRIKNSGKKDEYTTFESSFYTEFSTLNSLAGTSGPSVDIQTRMLKALYRAQNFIEKNSEQSRLLTTSFFNLDPKDLTSETWSKLRISLGLSAVLSSMLIEESSLISKSDNKVLLQPEEMKKFIFAEPLKEVNRDLVTFE